MCEGYCNYDNEATVFLIELGYYFCADNENCAKIKAGLEEPDIVSGLDMVQGSVMCGQDVIRKGIENRIKNMVARFKISHFSQNIQRALKKGLAQLKTLR